MEACAVAVAGRRARYRVTGAGAPIVLVHGLSGSWRWWRRVVPALAAEHCIYLVDLPGFGSLSSRGFRLAGAAEWLSEFLDVAGLSSAAVVGHSMGGLDCARLAALRPDRVDALVLVAPSGVPSGRTLVGHVLPLLTAMRLSTPSFLPVLVADAARAGPLTLLRAAGDLVTADVRGELASVRAPTLLVWGERDPLVEHAVAEEWRGQLERVEVAVLPRAAHVPMFDAPEAFADAILRFLRGG